MAIPAFLTMLAIPLTFSIANGLAFGFTAYTVMHVLRGKVPRSELDGLRAHRAVSWSGFTIWGRADRLKPG